MPLHHPPRAVQLGFVFPLLQSKEYVCAKCGTKQKFSLAQEQENLLRLRAVQMVTYLRKQAQVTAQVSVRPAGRAHDRHGGK